MKLSSIKYSTMNCNAQTNVITLSACFKSVYNWLCRKNQFWGKENWSKHTTRIKNISGTCFYSYNIFFCEKPRLVHLWREKQASLWSGVENLVYTPPNQASKNYYHYFPQQNIFHIESKQKVVQNWKNSTSGKLIFGSYRYTSHTFL